MLMEPSLIRIFAKNHDKAWQKRYKSVTKRYNVYMKGEFDPTWTFLGINVLRIPLHICVVTLSRTCTRTCTNYTQSWWPYSHLGQLGPNNILANQIRLDARQSQSHSYCTGTHRLRTLYAYSTRTFAQRYIVRVPNSDTRVHSTRTRRFAYIVRVLVHSRTLYEYL